MEKEYGESPLLKRFSAMELYVIYEDLSKNKWSNLLGNPPEGFDGLPERKHRKRQGKSKEDYTYPICCYIRNILGDLEMERLRHARMNEKDRLIYDLNRANPGSKIGTHQEIAEILAKNLDLR